MRRRLAAAAAGALMAAAAWLAAGRPGPAAAADWVEVVPGLFRTATAPFGYALVDGSEAVLIDAPAGAAKGRPPGADKVSAVWLTHHHRDTCAMADRFLKAGVPVRAPKASADWLLPKAVAKFWQESIPLRNSRTAYFVLPEGLEGATCDLEDGQQLTWTGWSVRVVGTPGHSRDHVAFAVRRGLDGPLHVCCGDALAEPSKLWTPYTTDWDHWTDAGLTPTAKSLRTLAALKPKTLLPAHGPVIAAAPAGVLTRTAAAVEDLAFLKSFERYTKQRLGDAPTYAFLAKDQVASAGEKPWTRVSDHLFLTGNTYVLTSAEKDAFLVVDPWGQRSADQIAKLKKDRKLGAMEVVAFSHAHFDHYDGMYLLPDRERWQVWTLDRVAEPIAEPWRRRAPFLDARPVKIDRRFKDGDTADWREYRFRFHHLPGQSAYTMGVEATIDGKKCYFTADNFFHQDQFSGSGGWMGLNRSWPLPYASSARKVLDAKPDWVLAEHGGPFEFNAEDFRRRVKWGEASAKSADAVCVSGDHRRDWDPNRVAFEPLLQKAKPGATLKGVLFVGNPSRRAEKWTVTLEGRGLTADQTWELEPAAGGEAKRAVSIRLSAKVPVGRHVFALRAAQGERVEETDAFLAVDVTE